MGERAMRDFMTGASWGAWFVLAAMIGAGLWAWLAVVHAVH